MKTSEAVVDKICYIFENCPNEWSYSNIKVTIKDLFFFRGGYYDSFESSSDLCYVYLIDSPEEPLLAFTEEQASKLWDSFEKGMANKLSSLQETFEDKLLKRRSSDQSKQ